MRPAPLQPNNKYTHLKRLEECEVVAHGAAAEVKRAHARLDAEQMQGVKGATGAPGGRGEPGLPGKDGRDGFPGRDALGLTGPAGRAGADGAPGKDAPQRVEFDNFLVEHRRELKAIKTAFEDLKLVVDAIYQQNKQSADYIAYLRDLRAKREAARK